ncbi:MAG: M23 family metallopeptidase [Candidatus Pacebacteria bacterium]|nr:M23 family metallopeptidase [Candidatus Paceibacterota bacterium]
MTSLSFALFLSLPPSVFAWGNISSFTDKVKAIFIQKEEEEEVTEPTAQTMALFKPLVVESNLTASSAEVMEEDSSALKAVSGPLRVSTEDIDFPSSDEISIYEVKKGDTITDVAKLFSVSVNTIMWANNLSSRTLKPGDTLIILPITGIKHTVKKGDSIKTLAKKYRADTGDIAKYNGISEDGPLAVGDTVIIPDGEIEIVQSTKPKTVTQKKPKILNSYISSTPSGFLIRPLVGGRRTQGLHGHNGVDIAATPGTEVVASGNGRVIAARVGGYNGGYGNMVIISHDGGVQTVYAHLREVHVSQGDAVVQGQVIGGVGNTGRSTGPHLHFEVRGAKNPF